MPLPHSVADLIAQSIALEQAGEIPAAHQKARLALETARRLCNPPDEAAALVCLARMRFRLGKYPAARSLAEQALALAAPEASACAEAWLVLGNCAGETNSLAEAETCYRRAAEAAREIGHYWALAAALHGLAVAVYLPRGQFDLALAADEEAWRIITDREIRERSYIPLVTMAWIYQLTGQGQRAHAALAEVGQIVVPGSLSQGYCFWIEANLNLDEGEPEAARQLYVQTRAIAETTGEPFLNVEARLGMSRCARQTGDGPAARHWAADALAFADRVGYAHEQGRALIERGRAAWLCDDPAAAQADLERAAEILAELGAAFDLARARLISAALLHEIQPSTPAALAAWNLAAQVILDGGYVFLLEQERLLAFPLAAAYLNCPEPGARAGAARLLEQLERLTPPPLRVNTLGRFEVWRGKQPVGPHAWSQRRAGELFRLLLVSPECTLSRDQAAEALWPAQAPASAQARLYQTTSALRRVLEPELPERFPSRYLDARDDRLALRLPPGSQVDFEDFARLVQQQDWEAALALYQGDLFPSDLYADWATGPREYSRRLFLQAALAAAQQYLDTGRPHEALETCFRILGMDPWQERAVWLGMQACLALENRSGAIRLYLDLERVLKDELGIAPRPDLCRLYQSLL
jgi:DNA-binding SARP family transcriptional activator